MRHYPEILAPAGSMEALTAAVHCGADAVYLGATLFSARQNAHNFDASTLQEAAAFCHTNGVKVYLTVNTLIFDTEWKALDQLLQIAAACGIDACIVQDLGVADYIRHRIPDMPLHASTQMTIYSPAGAIWAKEHGFSRVVVAREMSRTEIQKVCEIGLEVEQFVHGALCMCISGQCYLSAMIGSRSANRGCCAQACRLPFTAKGNRQAAALSLKDVCLLPHYQKLCEDGIASLKIEGRMKRPEYVAAAVTALRQLREGQQPDLQMLRAVFSRSGFTDGYYTGKRTQMFGTRQKEDVKAAETVLPKLAELAKKPAVRVPVAMTATVRLGQPITLTASLPDGTSVTVRDVPAEPAKNKPCDAALLERQLSKLGNTAYELDSLTTNCDGRSAISAAALNALRRTATDELDALRRKNHTPIYSLKEVPPLPKECHHQSASLPAYWIQVRTKEQLQAVQNS
ncbi:MAG: U32 family peptidase, partial [Ruminococcus sp.]